MIAKLAYFRVCLLKIIYRLIVPLLYRDKKVRKAHLKAWTTKTEKKYLQRYLYVLQNQIEVASPCPNIIWVCWMQGMENAPEVIQKCFASLKKYCVGFDIKIVSYENLKTYVTLPDYIWKKYNNKQITNTQFSDILRLCLLQKYGGYWFDATVFLTDKLPEAILNAPFFAYHSNTYLKNNSWFLKSAPNDLIITNMKNLMLEYWKYENRMLNYFLYHLFFDLMMEKNACIAQEWSKCPVFYDDCYDLEYNFFTPYSQEIWENFKRKTSIHKLSYKYNKHKKLEGTFLEYLLNDKLK